MKQKLLEMIQVTVWLHTDEFKVVRNALMALPLRFFFAVSPITEAIVTNFREISFLAKLKY